MFDLIPENVREHSLFCIKDPENPGFQSKYKWFTKRYQEGLRIKILKDRDDTPFGFIEYVPAEFAWRPVHAPGFMFIHCMMLYPNKYKHRGFGSMLLKACETESKANGNAGICVMTSNGTWIADNTLFEKHGYKRVDQKERFSLLAKTWDKKAAIPFLLDWTTQQKKYKGWHLVYADQCPWHEKAAQAIRNTADEYGIPIRIRKLTQAKHAQKSPSGFGVFSLLKDGELLADHYISETRFRSILNKELAY